MQLIARIIVKTARLFNKMRLKMQDIINISEEGYRMPQKSTYFYPKLLSGLVINLLENIGEN